MWIGSLYIYWTCIPFIIYSPDLLTILNTWIVFVAEYHGTTIVMSDCTIVTSDLYQSDLYQDDNSKSEKKEEHTYPFQKLIRFATFSQNPEHFVFVIFGTKRNIWLKRGTFSSMLIFNTIAMCLHNSSTMITWNRMYTWLPSIQQQRLFEVLRGWCDWGHNKESVLMHLSTIWFSFYAMVLLNLCI